MPVHFNVPKEYNVNDEKLTEEELDAKVNPYLVDPKIANPLSKMAPSPKELPQDSQEVPKPVRVGRPLRHVRHKPTKEYTFVTNKIFPVGANYSKIKFPLKPNTMIVQVKYFAVNPVDIKIWNYYTTDITGAEKGFGREYSGVVYQVADQMNEEFKDFAENDAVCGLYFHLFAKGCSASHILIDLNKDPVVKVEPDTVKMFGFQRLGGWVYQFLTAFQMVNSISTGGLNSELTVLVNGGLTNTGMMLIQILKNYFHVTNIVAICLGTASDLVRSRGASVIIDYKKDFDIVKLLQELLSNGKKTVDDGRGNQVEVLYPDKKFDYIFDFIGGTKLSDNYKVLLNEKNSMYLTLVGTKKADYKSKDFVYRSEGFGGLASYMPFGSGLNYRHVYFNAGDVKGMNKLLKTGRGMITQLQLDVQVNSVFKMTQIKKALDKVKTQHALGCVLVECEDF